MSQPLIPTAPKDIAWLLPGDDAEGGKPQAYVVLGRGIGHLHRSAQTLHSIGKSGIRSGSEHHQLSNI